MAMSLSDKPNDDKPAASAPVKEAPAKAEKKSEKLDTSDPKLNNETNVYGETSDHSAEGEHQAKIAKIDDKSADVLSAAAASGDAAVQNLLGQRAIAELNADEDELKRIDKELAEIVK